MSPPVSRVIHPAPANSAARLTGRVYFGASSVGALGSATILATSPVPEYAVGSQATLIASVLAFSALCAVFLWLCTRPRFPMNAAMCIAAIAAIGLTGAISVALGDGARNPSMGFCALVVCIVSAITRLRYGMLLCLLSLLQIGALGLVEVTGMLPPPAGSTPLQIVLLYQALVIVSSLAVGGLLARLVGHYLSAAAEREDRFHGLLRIAANWYWEQNSQYQFTYVSESSAGVSGQAPTEFMLRTLWQIPDTELTEDQLDAHRADLESRRPFSGLLTRLRDNQNQLRIHSLSGEPRFDTGGTFCGYWGVARDVTDEVRTQHAVKASEMRYRELFTRSPTPLFLHRQGVIFDANDAAARLFGFPDAAAMNNFNFINLFPPGDMRNRIADRITETERLTLGEGVAVGEFQVRSVDGRALSVQDTAVRVDTAGGPATLSIFLDITARQAAEVALRRSEAMLSHLFATSPDGIALTEMATGRYAMVNPAFCRLTGFAADEVIGRTATELGLWDDPHHFERLATLLERDGTVIDMPAMFVSRSGTVGSMLLAAGRFAMDQRDYMVLNARDVTASERTRLEHSAILERASIGIAFTRAERFVQANPYFESMFGWTRGALLGQPGSAVWGAETDYADYGDHGEPGNKIHPLLSAGKPFEVERQMRRPDGSQFWCRLLVQAVDLNDPGHGGTIWIAEDVTERRRLTQALATARDAAESASLAKSAFLANTSHEIRTPLNGLLGLARMAMQPDLADRRLHQYLAQIFDSAQNLADIMSDILDVSKIEAGKIALEAVSFDLRDSLQTAYQTYVHLAESKGLELRLEIDNGLPKTVRGDPLRLRQILSNFINNALKFTEHGSVTVAAARTAQGDLRFTVTDTGPGVLPATQELLFTPFTQGDSSTTRRYGGTGLGLAICRELAHLMGGRVGVISLSGVGSTFWAELPLPDTEPAQPPENTEAADMARLTGKRVLVVEDNPVNMMICVAMLEHWGVRVAQASDGRLALGAVHGAVIDGEPFDAVLMDVQMPVMGGHEAARQLRQHYPSQVLTIIALTAAAQPSERTDALAAGMDDFLTKPIDARHLRQTLARYMVV